jgi:hypothetical protein
MKTSGGAGGHMCPRCGVSSIHRSSMPWFLHWWLPRIFLRSRPYRCDNCSSRFWDRPLSPAQAGSGSRAGTESSDSNQLGVGRDASAGTY